MTSWSHQHSCSAVPPRSAPPCRRHGLSERPCGSPRWFLGSFAARLTGCPRLGTIFQSSCVFRSLAFSFCCCSRSFLPVDKHKASLESRIRTITILCWPWWIRSKVLGSLLVTTYGLGSVTLGCSRFFSFRCFYCLELEHDGDAATRSDSTPPARPSQYPPVDCRLEILLFSASERSSSCCFFAGGTFRDYFGDFVWSCRAVFGALLCAGLKYRLSRAPGTLPRGFLI